MLINIKHTKQYILDFAKMNRPRFTRISKEFLLKVEDELKISIANHIKCLPSVGKTIK